MEKNNQSNMSDVTLIPAAERSKVTCAICGTKLSVKYRLSSNVDKCYCNKCVLFRNKFKDRK